MAGKTYKDTHYVMEIDDRTFLIFRSPGNTWTYVEQGQTEVRGPYETKAGVISIIENRVMLDKAMRKPVRRIMKNARNTLTAPKSPVASYTK
jgi:hypothetical protein